jgi:hypothetical protein
VIPSRGAPREPALFQHRDCLVRVENRGRCYRCAVNRASRVRAKRPSLDSPHVGCRSKARRQGSAAAPPRSGAFRTTRAPLTAQRGGRQWAIEWVGGMEGCVEKAAIIAAVCDALRERKVAEATRIITSQYRFEPPPDQSGAEAEAIEPLEIFDRDGYVDRYSGLRLVFPGALRVISMWLPDAFPYHPNWKMDECHIAYYELFPVLDHIRPRARGGKNMKENMATTSTLRNSAKANFTLDELGWRLLNDNELRKWDGLLPWFMEQVKSDKDLLKDANVRRWHRAAVSFNSRASGRKMLRR